MHQVFFLFFPYIALISAFAAQMALLGFIYFYFIPLFISPGMCHLMVEDYSRACQREIGKKKEEEEKKAQKKNPLRHDRDLSPSVLSVRPRRPTHPEES